TTLVPLAEPHPWRPISASSSWAWGTVALSVPPDPLSFAETLVHEFYHLILSAAEETIELITETDHRPYYAPWRDDARFLPELLQGCYAHLGITKFWRRQRSFGSRRARQRGHVEFARRVLSTFEASQALTASDALSEAGHTFVTRMSDRLAEWRNESIPMY